MVMMDNNSEEAAGEPVQRNLTGSLLLFSCNQQHTFIEKENTYV
jgi:hypothetical protein